MFNFYKLLFFFSLISSSLITISSYSWFGMWMGLEINLMSFIPLMNNSMNKLSIESTIKYFIVQVLSSMILIYMFIIISMSSIKLININYLLILNSSLLMKMGAAPFHFWLPEVMENISWFNNTIMLTWQKIAPMIIMVFNTNMLNFFIIIIIMCMIISGIMGLNQIKLKKMMSYSSINHIGWLISTNMFSELLWLYYLIIYSMITISIILMFKLTNSIFLNQMFMKINKNIIIKMLFFMNFFSLSGMPPFLGFIPKWMSIQLMINNNLYWLPFIMIIFTLLTMFWYIRIMFTSLIMNYNELNWTNKKYKFNFMIYFLNSINIFSFPLCLIFYNWI